MKDDLLKELTPEMRGWVEENWQKFHCSDWHKSVDERCKEKTLKAVYQVYEMGKNYGIKDITEKIKRDICLLGNDEDWETARTSVPLADYHLLKLKGYVKWLEALSSLTNKKDV